MTTNLTPRSRQRGGYALVMVMVFAAIGLTVLTGTMNWASQTALMNERNNQLNTTTFAAEAATERIVSVPRCFQWRERDGIIGHNDT